MATIVSLTSWKPRFPIVIDAINSILSGDVLPDKIVLVIAHDETESLPKSITSLVQKNSIELLLYDDIGSHKKLLPVMGKYPDYDLITIDDDWVYGPSFVAELIRYHQLYPNDVLCNWCSRIGVTESGMVAPYNTWYQCVAPFYGDLDLFPMSGAGALWPAHCFERSGPDLSELNKCPNADDIYNKVLMIRNNVIARKVPCDCRQSFSNYDIVSSTALSMVNVSGGKNNAYVREFDEYRDLCKQISRSSISKVDTTPYGFSIKINEMKTQLGDELHTMCADKVLMKKWVAGVLGNNEHTVPTIGVYDSIGSIPLSLSNVIIKCNHGSMMNRIFTDSVKHNHNALAILDKYMQTDYSMKFNEMQYKNIPRKLLIEPLLSDVTDVKVYAAYGNILAVQYNVPGGNDRLFFDEYGNYLPDMYLEQRRIRRLETVPENIREICDAIRDSAQKLSRDFNFVRVDFLWTGNRFYVGELTFTPFAGNKRFCGQYDRVIGDKIFSMRPNRWKTEALLLTKYLSKYDLAEWLEWHLTRKGIEHVHIFDNNNSYDIRPVVEPYGERVSYESVVGHPRQYDLYNRYISYQSVSEWVMPIDDDEYLDFDKTKFGSAYDMLRYYSDLMPDMAMLAIRWKHMFPKDLMSERNGSVLDYCTEDNIDLAQMFGSGNRGIKCFVRRNGIIHYEETSENPSGGHVPKHSKASGAHLYNGKIVTATAVDCTPVSGTGEYVRLLHCRYKGYSDWKSKYFNDDPSKNCMTVCDSTTRQKRFRFNQLFKSLYPCKRP